MSQQAIHDRAAVVRKSWTYRERLQRAVAAQQRCQHLLSQMGLIPMRRELALVRQSSRPCTPGLSS